MSGYRIVFIHAGPRSAGEAVQSAQPVLAAAQAPGVGDQIRNEIRQSIQDATRAAAESPEMQQELRHAQQQLRDAEQQLRDARTPDQRGAAEQALMGARAELDALQRTPVMVHTVPPPMLPEDMIPREAVDISIAFFIMIAAIIIGLPLARAIGRRLERHASVPAIADPAISGQLQRIEQAVEAMSIEIERISESQRFMAKLQNGAGTERSALGAGERP